MSNMHQILTTNRNRLMAFLKSLGICRVTIKYTGGGDSGDIQKFTVSPEEKFNELENQSITILESGIRCSLIGGNNPINTEISKPLIEALQDFTYSWIEHRFGDWEFGAGSSGTIFLNTETNACSIKHEEYVTEAIHYEAAI